MYGNYLSQNNYNREVIYDIGIQLKSTRLKNADKNDGPSCIPRKWDKKQIQPVGKQSVKWSPMIWFRNVISSVVHTTMYTSNIWII